jgi:hypothetical protein
MLTFFHVSGFGEPAASHVWREYVSVDTCSACGAKIEVRAYEGARVEVAGNGRRWPDILSSINNLILHERVVEEVTEGQLTGFVAHPVVIDKIENEGLAKCPLPTYYLIEITGRVDVDLEELDDNGGSVCPICFRRSAAPGNKYRWAVKRTLPKLETWDSSDFVLTRNWATRMIYCTKSFVDLACQHQWTNFRFGTANSIPGVGMWGKVNDGGVSYHDKCWFAKLAERVKLKYPDLLNESPGC